MPRQSGKGTRKRRQAAFERRATQHHEFIGETDAERAEAEFRKHERVEAERTREQDRKLRLVRQALLLAGEAAGLLIAPAVIGFHLAREVLRLPGNLLHALRHREA